jgi:hypothetical protein
MKFIMPTNKNWTRVALCAVAISSYAYSYAQTSETSISIIKLTGSFIVKIEQILAQFFNANNNISYNECDISLGKTLTEFVNKLDQIDMQGDAFSKKAHDIAQEARKHFNAAYSVIKQYNGAPATAATKFKSDIERVFSPEAAFSAITTKLRSLYKDAEGARDADLMNVIQQLMLILEKKKTEWSNKAGRSLLTGLAIRMTK